MLKKVAKLAMFAATSAVAVPYTLAFLANMLYGWPQTNNKYRRAFHPRKVYALTYSILQQTIYIKFAPLYLKWKKFYQSAPDYRLIKDISYGSNENCLDLYLPDPRYRQETGEGRHTARPIIVFIYGGAWGSGDKSTYGLLCCQLADRMQAIVACPNYSTYPKGYVDDMIQDVVDCMTWLQLNAEAYGADKENILLIGHSAGAHLCMMASLELTLKRLLHNPEAIILPDDHSPPSFVTSGLQFEESHFDGNSAAIAESSINTGSFYMVDNGNEDNGKSSDVSESFYMVNKNNGNQESDSNGESQLTKSMEVVDSLPEEGKVEQQEPEVEQEEKEVSVEKEKTDKLEKAEIEGQEKDKDDAEVKIRADGSGDAPGKSLELVIEDDDEMTRSQREVRDLLSSIRCIIGLAGVYNIGDHFVHEYMRGVEDVSSMAKAMYGPEHFDRFSPSHIVSNLPPRTRLPPIVLMHGTKDHIVPESSSDKFYLTLQAMGGTSVNYIKVPGCGHPDLCLDLMDTSRPFHIVMEAIKREAQLRL